MAGSGIYVDNTTSVASIKKAIKIYKNLEKDEKNERQKAEIEKAITGLEKAEKKIKSVFDTYRHMSYPTNKNEGKKSDSMSQSLRYTSGDALDSILSISNIQKAIDEEGGWLNVENELEEEGGNFDVTKLKECFASPLYRGPDGKFNLAKLEYGTLAFSICSFATKGLIQIKAFSKILSALSAVWTFSPAGVIGLGGFLLLKSLKLINALGSPFIQAHKHKIERAAAIAKANKEASEIEDTEKLGPNISWENVKASIIKHLKDGNKEKLTQIQNFINGTKLNAEEKDALLNMINLEPKFSTANNLLNELLEQKESKPEEFINYIKNNRERISSEIPNPNEYDDQALRQAFAEIKDTIIDTIGWENFKEIIENSTKRKPKEGYIPPKPVPLTKEEIEKVKENFNSEIKKLNDQFAKNPDSTDITNVDQLEENLINSGLTNLDSARISIQLQVLRLRVESYDKYQANISELDEKNIIDARNLLLEILKLDLPEKVKDNLIKKLQQKNKDLKKSLSVEGKAGKKAGEAVNKENVKNFIEELGNVLSAIRTLGPNQKVEILKKIEDFNNFDTKEDNALFNLKGNVTKLLQDLAKRLENEETMDKEVKLVEKFIQAQGGNLNIESEKGS